MKKSLFLILLLIVICIVPAAADDYGGGYFHLSGSTEAPTIEYELDVQDTSFVFDAPEGFAIAGVELWINPGASCNWTMFTDDYSISGWHDYQETGVLNATGSEFSTAVGSNVVTKTAIAPGWHYPEIFGVCPGIKYSGGAMDYEVISQGVFAYTPNYLWSSVHRDPARTVYQEISPLQVVRSVQVTNYEPTDSVYPVTIYLVTEDRALFQMEAFQPGASWSYNEQYGFDIDDLWDLFWRLVAMGESLYLILVIFEYIFVEHFFEVIMLYEVVLVAYSAYNSTDFISFCRKLSKANMKLFEFVLNIIEKMVSIVTRVIDVILPF